MTGLPIVADRDRLFIHQTMEWGEIALGFELNNRFALRDERGTSLGFAAEEARGVGQVPCAGRRAGTGVRGTMVDSTAERCRILVVEENVDVADALTMLLEHFGHDVQTVYSGQQALESIEREPPELAFVDIGMEGINGLEVARRVIARMGKGAPMLVAITGYTRAEDVVRSLAVGFDRHLGKPIDVAQIETVIRDCVARRP